MTDSFKTTLVAGAAALVLAAGIALPAMTMPSIAQTPAYGQTVPLTEDIVGRFVGSYEEISGFAEELGEQFDVPEGDRSSAEGFGGFLAYQGAMSQMDEKVRGHGFEGFMGWLTTMSSVMNAYTFARDGGAMDSKMAEAVAQIENNPNFTDEQKKMFLAQMSAATGAIAQMRPPQENIDAVTPYVGEIEILFDIDD